MFRRGARRAASLAVAAIAWSLVASVVLGHGGDPAIELDPETVVAGGQLEVAGENLEDVDSVELVLVGAGSKVSLGPVDLDSEGHFKTDVVVPADTTPGPYVIEADGPSGPLASAAVTVVPPTKPNPPPTASASAVPSPAPSAEPTSIPTTSSLPSTALGTPPGSPGTNPVTEPAAAADGMTILAVIAVAVVAGVVGGIVLARRGRPSA